MACPVELWSNHMDAQVLGFGLLIEKEFVLTFSKSLKHKHKGNLCCSMIPKMALKEAPSEHLWQVTFTHGLGTKKWTLTTEPQSNTAEPGILPYFICYITWTSWSNSLKLILHCFLPSALLRIFLTSINSNSGNIGLHMDHTKARTGHATRGHL